MVSKSASCGSLTGFLADDNYESDSAITQEVFEVNIEKEKPDLLYLTKKTNLKDTSAEYF